MRKFFILIAAAVFVFASCSYTIPKSVSVRTKAKYEFTVMEVKQDLSDTFNSDNMFQSRNASMTVYDYWPGKQDNVKRYLASVPVKSIPFDLSSYFADLSIGRDVSNNMSFDKEIVVPSFEQVDINESLSLDSLETALNALVRFDGKSSGKVKMIQQDKGSFRSITYTDGTLYVYTDQKPTSIVLEYNGNTIAKTSSFTDCSFLDMTLNLEDGSKFRPNYYGELSLNNKTIYESGMKITINGGASTYLGEIKYGTISEATGVSLNKAELDSPAIKLKTKMSDDTVDECVVGKGEVSLAFEQPADWSGSITTELAATLSGGLEVPRDKFVYDKTSKKYVADLQGCELGNRDTDLSPIIILTTSNATLRFAKKPSLVGNCSIEEFQSITVALPKGTETKIEKEESLADSMGDSVSKIVLGDSKLTGTYYNNLPAGNDFSLKCNSEFLGITDKSAPLKADPAYNAENPAPINIAADNGTSGKTVYAPLPDIDFTANFDFGAKEGYIKVNNVKAGETYNIGVNLAVDFDWKSLTAKAAPTSSGNEIVETGFELDSIFDSLKDLDNSDGTAKDNLLNAIELKSIPLYVYCQVPELKDDYGTNIFSGMDFTGNVVLGKIAPNGNFIAHKEGGVEKRLFDNQIKKAPVPGLALERDKDSIEDYATVNLVDEAYSAKEELLDILNSDDEGTLGFKCENLQITGGNGEITVTKELIEKNKKENTSASSFNVEIRAYVIIPLEFDVGKDGDGIDVYHLSMLNMGDGDSSDDIFGSDSDDGTSNSSSSSGESEAGKIIKSVSLSFKASELPFTCVSDTPELNDLGIILDLGSKSQTYTLDGKWCEIEKFDNVIDNFSLSKIMLGIPRGTFSINRNMNLKTTVNIQIATDGVISLSDVGGGDYL